MRRRQIVSKIILGYEVEPSPAIRAGKKSVSLFQSDGSSTLRALMFDFPTARFPLHLHRIVLRGS
jgi:hypothetical protein